jgi:hypothetical protein
MAYGAKGGGQVAGDRQAALRERGMSETHPAACACRKCRRARAAQARRAEPRYGQAPIPPLEQAPTPRLPQAGGAVLPHPAGRRGEMPATACLGCGGETQCCPNCLSCYACCAAGTCYLRPQEKR